jgi:hypothetical protein
VRALVAIVLAIAGLVAIAACRRPVAEPLGQPEPRSVPDAAVDPPPPVPRACTDPDTCPIEAKVIHFEKVAGGSVLTIAAGSDHGVTKERRAWLVDEDRREPIEVLRIERERTFARTPLIGKDLIHLRARFDVAAAPEPPAPPDRVRIVGAEAVAGGTKITIARGKDRGVRAGMAGRVVDQTGQAIPDGDFVISNVTDVICVATVKASLAQVKQAAMVELLP